jgi:4a-hydroxytetrahydrobiopterin dehydratase
MTMTKLDEKARTVALAALPAWQHDPKRDAIMRAFVFKDFMQAFAFMTEMAIWSEKHDHHPEWFNVYNKVNVTMTTHDAGGLSQRDVDWARHADAVAARGAQSK